MPTQSQARRAPAVPQRVKIEPNKEAILNEPDAVRGIAGISIVTGQEDFAVVPFEAKAEA